MCGTPARLVVNSFRVFATQSRSLAGENWCPRTCICLPLVLSWCRELPLIRRVSARTIRLRPCKPAGRVRQRKPGRHPLARCSRLGARAGPVYAYMCVLSAKHVAAPRCALAPARRRITPRGGMPRVALCSAGFSWSEWLRWRHRSGQLPRILRRSEPPTAVPTGGELAPPGPPDHRVSHR